MAIADRVLALKLVTDVGNLGSETKKATTGFKRMTGAAKSWGKAFGGALVISGIAALPGLISDLHKDFKEGEDAARSLGQTYKNLGLDLDTLGSTVESVAGLGLDMGFDDAETLAAFDKFVGLTGDADEASKLLSTAMDVARARGWSLGKAVKWVSGHMDDLTDATKENRGKAALWARNHPLEVATGKILDNIAGIVGALSAGDFGAAFGNLAAIGDNLDDLLFGTKTKVDLGHGIEIVRSQGLIDTFMTAGQLAAGQFVEGMKGLADNLSTFWDEEVATVDWGAAIVGALDTAFQNITSAEGIDVASAGAVIGGALALAVAGVSLFADALGAMFRAPGWLAKKGLGVAINVLGGILGGALALATATAEKFARELSNMLFGLPKGGEWTRIASAARHVGWKAGGAMIGGVVAFLTGAWAIGQVAGALRSLTKEDQVVNAMNLPDPVFKWPWSPGGFFDTLFHAGGTDSSPGGWAVVGEQGPELLHMARGARVLSNRDTLHAVGGGGSVNVTIQTGVGDPVAIGREVDRVLRAYRRRAGIPIAGAMT